MSQQESKDSNHNDPSFADSKLVIRLSVQADWKYGARRATLLFYAPVHASGLVETIADIECRVISGKRSACTPAI